MNEIGKSQHLTFFTGKLAAPALETTLRELSAETHIRYEIVVLNIAVAALMTVDWISRQVRSAPECDCVILPGYVSGDLETLRTAFAVDVKRGPKDLRDLPRFFGSESRGGGRYDGSFSIEIIAEINHAPQLQLEEIRESAARLRQAGADVIDVGCDPGGPFTGVGEVVRMLKAEGHRISIDSLHPEEIVDAVEAGAELVLSVNASNVAVAKDLECEFVVIPDEPSSLRGMAETASQLDAWGKRYRLDPVLEPIGFGFAQSLARYLETRKDFPEAAMMMGVGNLTELTGADSAAVNVILLGFCEELSIRSVLTTEVIHWAQTCVRELDLARRLVHYAVKNSALPKHVEPLLHLLRDPTVKSFGADVLSRLAAEIKDKNFRLFAENDRIHAMSAGIHVTGTDPFEVFEQLTVEDPAHAFYLGYEMAKAVTAMTLGKNYAQDESLRWGFLTREEESQIERHTRRRSKPS